MNQGIKVFICPVKDIARAKTLYSKLLGIEPYVDSAYYVGFKIGDQELGLDPNGHNKGMTGPVGYWPVNNIKKSLQSLLAARGEMVLARVKSGTQHATHTDETRPRILTRA
jgi:hypothetical protein